MSRDEDDVFSGTHHTSGDGEQEETDAYDPPRVRRIGTLPASTGMPVSKIGLPEEPQK